MRSGFALPVGRTHREANNWEENRVLIAGIIAVCIVLAILAFLVPRLSHGPQKGVDKTLGVGQSAGGKAPGPLGRLFQKPFSTLAQGDEQERAEGPRGPLEAADGGSAPAATEVGSSLRA